MDGSSHFVLYREVVLLQWLKCTSIIEKGPQTVSFIERLSSLWRLKCTSIIEKGPQSVSFIERFFSIVSFIQSVHYQRFYCIHLVRGVGCVSP